MKVHPSADQNGNKPDAFSSRPALFSTIFTVLIALAVGGCLTLIIISRMLQNLLEVYVSNESMDAASTILDLMDDFLPLYLLCGSVLLLLVFLALTIWVLKRTDSRLLRYVIIFLFLLVLTLIAAFWLLGVTSVPVTVPQLLPTAVAPG
jgi:hypothetical protein